MVQLLNRVFDPDKDIESVITSEARTSLVSASSIMVSLRKEDTNKYCGGSKYCRKLNPICKKEDLYEVYVGQGGFALPLNSSLEEI